MRTSAAEIATEQRDLALQTQVEGEAREALAALDTRIGSAAKEKKRPARNASA